RYEGSWERAELVADVTALAHQRGMKVLLKPQIWTGRGFPGDIFYEKPEDRARWFQQYRGFVEYWARHAAKIHADLFCVGVEFVKMTQYEAEWRSLIARARALYPGPLVYGATQGPEFETIRFWDALDYIGLNSYYPLPDELTATAVLRKVEDVQRRFKRPVLLTEAGFTSMKAPHRAPWDETRREISLDEQARCYEAIFKAFYRQPWFQGMYWWKVGTDGHGGPKDGSFTPWKKPAMDVVAHWYQQGGR
ncbi:MAG: glycoside hydrolase family 113, partial [Bryobacteraceae bacterium]